MLWLLRIDMIIDTGTALQVKKRNQWIIHWVNKVYEGGRFRSILTAKPAANGVIGRPDLGKDGHHVDQSPEESGAHLLRRWDAGHRSGHGTETIPVATGRILGLRRGDAHLSAVVEFVPLFATNGHFREQKGENKDTDRVLVAFHRRFHADGDSPPAPVGVLADDDFQMENAVEQGGSHGARLPRWRNS